MAFSALDPDRGFDEFAVNLINKIAVLLIRCYGFPASDREDYEHQLAEELTAKFPLWDPAKGARTTFVATVLNHKKIDMIRARRAERRDGRPISLDATTVHLDGEPVEMSRTIHDADKRRHMGQSPLNSQSQWELRHDLRELAKRLTLRERNLYRLRLKGLTIRQAADALGISRTSASKRFRRIKDKAARLFFPEKQ